MTRTTRALRRLAVAGLAVATIGAGVPALIGASAQAATGGPTAQLTITPTQQAGAAGTCMIYSATPTDAVGNTPSDTGTQTILLTARATGSNDVSFCAPSPSFPTNGTSTAGTPLIKSTATGTAAPAAAGTAAAANGTRTFGIRSDSPGGADLRAFVDRNANGAFDAGEPTGTATAQFTTGGTNSNDITSGGNAAQDAVKTVTEVAQSSTAQPITASAAESSRQFLTVQAKNVSGNTVSGVTVSAQFGAGSANGAQPASGTTSAQPAQSLTCRTGGTTTDVNGNITSTPTASSTTATGSQGGGTVTNNNGVVTCSYIAARQGTDTIVLFVNQTSGNTSGPDAGEPQLTVTRATQAAANTNPAQARFLDLTPNGPISVTSGGPQVFTATVTDANGPRVAGAVVDFSRSGTAGRFSNGTSAASATTNNFGQATVTLTSVAGETGQAIVTASLNAPAGTQCQQAAGQGTPSSSTTPAGVCTDSTVVNFLAGSASPSASPTASPTGSPGPRQNLTLSTSTPLIPAGSTATLVATGSANQQYELRCYTRPSTTYVTSRSGSFDAAGNPVTFTLSLGRNTRCFIQYAVNSGSNASPSVVINVRTVLSLSTVRIAVRTYVFQGRNLPRVAGQLITLYRVDNKGQEIRTSNLVTDSSGIYRVTRKFIGNGTFRFKVRTSQTLSNAAGVSNTITVTVR